MVKEIIAPTELSSEILGILPIVIGERLGSSDLEELYAYVHKPLTETQRPNSLPDDLVLVIPGYEDLELIVSKAHMKNFYKELMENPKHASPIGKVTRIIDGAEIWVNVFQKPGSVSEENPDGIIKI